MLDFKKVEIYNQNSAICEMKCREVLVTKPKLPNLHTSYDVLEPPHVARSPF